MTRKQITATIAAGAAVVALTIAGAANATTIFGLADLGYAVSMTDLGGGCTVDTAAGYGSSWSGNTCDPGFQAGLDGFAAGHPDRKLTFEHPGAASARGDLQGKGYSVSTSYDGPSFHVSGDCNVDSTVDAAGIVALDASLPASAPCQAVTAPAPAPAPVTTTDTGTTATAVQASPQPVTGGCDVQCQITDLQAQIQAVSDRLTRLTQVLEQWPSLDPGILAQLMSLQP